MIPTGTDAYAVFCQVLGAVVSFLIFCIGLVHVSIGFYDQVAKPTYLRLADRMRGTEPVSREG